MPPPVHTDGEGSGRDFRQLPGQREAVGVFVLLVAHLAPVDEELDLPVTSAGDVNAYGMSSVFDMEVLALVHSGLVQALVCGRGLS